MKSIHMLILSACLLFPLCGGTEEAPRVWKSKAGSEITAVMEKAEMSQVVLRNTEGRTFIVPLVSLIEEDQEYVRNALRKEDEHLQHRILWFERQLKNSGFEVPVFRDGPWIGATAVVETRNYTYVLAGNFRAALYLKNLSPDAVRDAPLILSPTFHHRNPEAPEKERNLRPLVITGVESNHPLPVLLDATPRGAELHMDFQFENGRTGSLTYTFETDGIRIRAKVSDFKHPGDVSAVHVGNQFPATHDFPKDMVFEDIQKALAPWRLELTPLGGSTETLAWSEGGRSAMLTKLEVVGPWEPWRFEFEADKMQLGLYQGFAPYRKGFRLNRWAEEVDGDLEIDWTMKLKP